MDTTSQNATNIIDIPIDGASYAISLPFADSDYIQKGLRATKKPYELEMLRAMAASISAGDHIIDVGANVGNHTIYLAAVRNARITAYEPDLRLTDALNCSIRANSMEEQVEVRQVAVANSDSELILVDDVAGNMGAQHVTSDLSATGQRVPVVRLDDEMPAQSVHAIKIDVEGYETNVLDGAKALLARDHPELWIECLDADHYRAISNKIRPLGYRFNGVYNPSPTYHFIHDPSPAREDLEAAVDRIVERFYLDHSSFIQARESLLVANAKYRKVVKQYNEVRGDIFEASNDPAQIDASRLAAIQHAEERSAELQAQLEDVLAEMYRTKEQYSVKENEASEPIRRTTEDHGQILQSPQVRMRQIHGEAFAEIDKLLARTEWLAATLKSRKGPGDGLDSNVELDSRSSEELQNALDERDTALSSYAKLKQRNRADFDLLRDYVTRSDVLIEELEESASAKTARLDELGNLLAEAEKARGELESALSWQEARGQELAAQYSDQAEKASSRSLELRALKLQHKEATHELIELRTYQRRLIRARDNYDNAAESLRAKLVEREHELHRTRAELNARDGSLATRETELDLARSELEALRLGRTYRAGEAWDDAGTWRGFWLLIPRLFKIARERHN